MATETEVFPHTESHESFCDIHLHFREPGGDPEDPAETINSGSKAGASSGVTHGSLMPNLTKADGTKIPVDNPEAVADQYDRIKKTSYMDLGVNGLVWGPSFSNLKDMQGKVLFYKGFGDYSTGGFNMTTPEERREATATIPAGEIFAVHAEEETLVEMLGYGEEFDTTMHVLHIRSRNELEAAYAAKLRRPGRVTIGVNPAYLRITKDHRSLFDHPGYAKVKPEPGTEEDRQALAKAVQLGVIDIFETDHAPHRGIDKKNSDWNAVPFGLSMLDTVFPLLWTEVVEGRLTRKQLVDMYCRNPRRIFRIPPSPGSYFVFDPNVRYKIGPPYHSKSNYSSFEGLEVQGKVLRTFSASRCIYDEGDFPGKPEGQVILPGR